MFQIKKIQVETQNKFPSLMELKKILDERNFIEFCIWKKDRYFRVELESRLFEFRLFQNDEKGNEFFLIGNSVDRILQEYENFLKNI